MQPQLSRKSRNESVARVRRLIVRLNRARRRKDLPLVRELDGELSEYDRRRGWERSETIHYGMPVPKDGEEEEGDET